MLFHHLIITVDLVAANTKKELTQKFRYTEKNTEPQYLRPLAIMSVTFSSELML